MVGERTAAELLLDFKVALRDRPQTDVLEMGTKRSNPEVSTVHHDWYPPEAKLVLTDFEAGQDVDVVADIHELSKVFGEQRFDFIVNCSVYEHLKRPWIATQEVFRTLRPGGMVFIQTHQSFPIHGYPFDYWRFTTEALELLFEDAGLEVVGSAYEFPCEISAPQTGPHRAPSYLNVVITGRRPA